MDSGSLFAALCLCMIGAGRSEVPPCASMRTWFPGTPPLSFADNLPYQLSVTGVIPRGENAPFYYPESLHTVYLNGSVTADNKMRSFVAFIIYAENSVENYTNGHFIEENLPVGVEIVNCSSLRIVQNSTSNGNWTSLKLQWKAPKTHLAGNITFKASVVMSANPLSYFEGFQAQLRYQCPLRKCVPCPNSRYKFDEYGCRTCECEDHECPVFKCVPCPNNRYKSDEYGCQTCECEVEALVTRTRSRKRPRDTTMGTDTNGAAGRFRVTMVTGTMALLTLVFSTVLTQ